MLNADMENKMTSMNYNDYRQVFEAKHGEYRDGIRRLAKRLVDEGKTYEDLAELFMDTTKCIAFDHALFCYFMHYKTVGDVPP